MSQYATFAQFTAVYSVRGVGQPVIDEFLQQGSTMLNERLGNQFTTPFSSNNLTAVELSRDFAMYLLQVRTITPGDSAEIKELIDDRIEALMNGAPMSTTSGDAIATIDPSNTVFSTHETFKSTFDMRDESFQRVDPDLIEQLDEEDDIFGRR